MQFDGLKQFVEILKRYGQVVEIETFVDPVLEISEITDRITKQPYGGKVLLFKNTGTNFPVVTNLFGSEFRLALALRHNNLSQIGQNLDLIFKFALKPRRSFLQKLSALSKLKRFGAILPIYKSSKGKCQEVVYRQPDLNILPVLKLWPEDGGRFLTLPLVHTYDPIERKRNVGMYRIQIFDSQLAAIHWHRHKTGAKHFRHYKRLGKEMPVAIVLGGDPVYTYVATAPLPDGIDEYILAGYLRGKPVELVKCITQDIYVPADADIVIEGYVDPDEEFILEGPFGDHTGFYSMPDYYPRFHVTCITHRKDAVYPATVVGIPPQEDYYFAKATERIFLSLVKNSVLDEVIDWDIPAAGTGHNLAIVQIKKAYPGQGKKVITALWGSGQMMFNKIMIVLNSDIDIRDYEQVLATVLKNVNPKKDFVFTYGVADVLDHASERFTYGSKLGIDATEKFPEENLSQEEVNDAEIKDIDHKIFSQCRYIRDVNLSLLSKGYPVIIFSVDKEKNVREIAKEIIDKFELKWLKYAVFVDSRIPAYNLFLVAWYALANLAPQRDIFFIDDVVVIDGTYKTEQLDNITRQWPKMALMDRQTIAKVDSKWQQYGFDKFVSSFSLKIRRK